jgi:hypothetical protein
MKDTSQSNDSEDFDDPVWPLPMPLEQPGTVANKEPLKRESTRRKISH